MGKYGLAIILCLITCHGVAAKDKQHRKQHHRGNEAGSQKNLPSKGVSRKGKKNMELKPVTDVIQLFPTTVEEITERVTRATQEAQKAVEAIIALQPDQRSFDNTMRALDRAVGAFAQVEGVLSALENSHPDEAIRAACHAALLTLKSFSVDTFTNNLELYNAVKSYVEGAGKDDPLNAEQRYFVTELMNDFRRAGLELSATQLQKSKKLQKEIAALCLQFEKNIADGQRSIVVTKDELEGLEEDFINNLKQTEAGGFTLTTDYPTYFHVMENCAVEATRRKLYLAFGSRAYPENITTLNELIAKRDEFAQLLGFANYAAYDIENQMAQSVDRVRELVDEVAERARVKYEREFAEFTKELPASVALTAEGKLQPWDMPYVLAQHKKKYYAVDERAISEYFPMEHTIKGLIAIYEQFMSLKIVRVSAEGLWHPDIQMLAVYDNIHRLRGYLILDLHPRPNKFSHAASLSIVRSVKGADGQPTVAVDLVLANFPKSSKTRPALLKHSDVETFFHEFGHAIHTILGTTEFSTFSGTATKSDFVELPSQILEEWIWDKAMLQKISSSFKTGESLPEELIDKKIALKRMDSALFTLRQIALTQMSLAYYGDGARKDLLSVAKKAFESYSPRIVYEPAFHQYTSFGHLADYGAKYYCYLWSKIFALDIFAEIKKKGLLNPEIGSRYVTHILSKGGSVDPNQLLQIFLGRAPSREAYYQDLGF